MEYFKGEIIDRFTILCLKIDKLPYCTEITTEYELFKKEKRQILTEKPEVEKIMDELYAVNKHIWELESDIRQGKEDKMTLSEVGKRALEIRDWNNTRVELKNQINEIFEECQDIKIDHASENGKPSN